MHRYYYYAGINRRTYDDTINILSEEFFLSEGRIIVCLNEHHPRLKEIFKARPDVKELKNTYGWLVW